MNITVKCSCGHTADADQFIDDKKITSRWYQCPCCKTKFSGPSGPLEIGVQEIRNGVRTEIPPSDKFDREIREWKRDEYIKKHQTGQLALIV
ncbi:hypothetical protein KAR91_52540 [Candidatus Pacearchaeota archaeon]|nr:hypothetical protein [Candidatus Pacearchaeota archaeon]